MSTITFDTLKFADTLKAAGVPVAHAEAEARAVAAAIGEVDVATKRDIDDMRKDLQSLELRITDSLRRDIKESELRMVAKLGAMMAVSVGVVAALVKLL